MTRAKIDPQILSDAEIETAWEQVQSEHSLESPDLIPAWSDETIEEWMNDPRR